jgi:RNA polymerase sigma-70 factor (ECF subfamily)
VGGGRSDAELVRRSLAGDRSAFGELAERYARPIAALTYALVRDREKARDMAQEALLEAYEALRNLREPAKFGGWLSGIARRRCIYAIRRELLAALGGLGRRYREVLVLRHFEGRSYAEIAELLAVSVATVEKRLTRARTRLRELLGDGRSQ